MDSAKYAKPNKIMRNAKFILSVMKTCNIM